jgi:hypothetical protein
LISQYLIVTEPEIDEPQEPSNKVDPKFSQSMWYKDIIFYLQNLQCPPDWDKAKARSIKLKAVKYCIIDEHLFWKDPRGILLNCITEEETQGIIVEFHKGVCGGHHAWRDTTYKILRVGYYWPTLFSDANSLVRACLECQIFVGKQNLFPLPLRPIKVEAPFQQWGLDFIGEINPNSSGQHKWILTATDYFTKWVEAIPTRAATYSVIIKFLEENILSQIWFPKEDYHR